MVRPILLLRHCQKRSAADLAILALKHLLDAGTDRTVDFNQNSHPVNKP